MEKFKIKIWHFFLIVANIVEVKNSESMENKESTSGADRPDELLYHYCPWNPYLINWTYANREEKCHEKCARHKAFLRPDNGQLICYSEIVEGERIWKRGPNLRCECGMIKSNPNAKDPSKKTNIASCQNLPYKIILDDEYYKHCKSACAVVRVFLSKRERSDSLVWCYHENNNLSIFDNGVILEGVTSERKPRPNWEKYSLQLSYIYECRCAVRRGKIEPTFEALLPIQKEMEAIFKPEFHHVNKKNHRRVVRKLILSDVRPAPRNETANYSDHSGAHISNNTASEIDLRATSASESPHNEHYTSQKSKKSHQTKQLKSKETRHFRSLSITGSADTCRSLSDNSLSDAPRGKQNSAEVGDSSTKRKYVSEKNATNELICNQSEKDIDITDKRIRELDINYCQRVNIDNSPDKQLTVLKPVAKMGEVDSLDTDKLRLFDLNIACPDDSEQMKKIKIEKKGSGAFVPFVKS